MRWGPISTEDSRTPYSWRGKIWWADRKSIPPEGLRPISAAMYCAVPFDILDNCALSKETIDSIMRDAVKRLLDSQTYDDDDEEHDE